MDSGEISIWGDGRGERKEKLIEQIRLLEQIHATPFEDTILVSSSSSYTQNTIDFCNHITISTTCFLIRSQSFCVSFFVYFFYKKRNNLFFNREYKTKQNKKKSIYFCFYYFYLIILSLSLSHFQFVSLSVCQFVSLSVCQSA